jgi:hypothetical protein
MKRLTVLLLALMTTGMLGACAEEGRYPISGEECGPNDPVKDIEPVAGDCVPSV